MNDFEKALLAVDNFCKINSIDYAVIGGVAVVAYGSLRTKKILMLHYFVRLMI